METGTEIASVEGGEGEGDWKSGRERERGEM